jgi:putative multiple sugar transport system ATP-binding protein
VAGGIAPPVAEALSHKMSEFILEMRSISKSFPGVRALQDVTLEVRQGEIHAICGENGAGKSTLMKVLGGVYPHGSYEGEIFFVGQACSFKDIKQSEQLGIVIIHQELALIPYLNIAENIFLGNEYARAGVIDWDETFRRATALMKRVGLSDSPATRVADIGVGKQQLVEIAKALSKEVKLLILDEPTAALNDDDSRKMLDLLREFKAHGIASVIISHKLNEISAVADAITILRDGRVIETLRVDGRQVSEEKIIRGMVGRDLEHRFPERVPNVGEIVFAVENWTVHHPIDQKRKVVDNVSLNVRRGEIVGIAGLVGAGRTELAMSVFGHSYGTNVSGRVLRNGKEVRTTTVSAAMGNGIAYLTEDRKHYGLNLLEDVKRNISMAALEKVSVGPVVDENKERVVAERYRKLMNIKTSSVEASTSKLSGGNQQKVVFSKWIFADPQVLILDEPTRGIDVGAKFEIYTIMNRLANEGRAVILISAELPELLGMCDRIYTLSRGRLTGEFSREQATQERLMRLMTMDR